jgi:hypothetical protein
VARMDYFEAAPRPTTTAPIDARLCEILNGQLKWLTLSWNAPTSFPNDEVTIRGSAMAAYAIAVTTQTQVWDPVLSGVPNYQTSINKATTLIAGVAAAHVANSTDPAAWGRTWESALWAGILGKAAWLLSTYLSTAQLNTVLAVLEDEANYRLTIQPRYMYAPDGTVLTPGDSGAEENEWNALAPAVAYCMMPTHPNAAAWLSCAVAYWAAAYCHQTDLTSPTLVNGVPINGRLAGWNVEADYTVTNHNRTPNPDYTSCISLAGSAAVAFGLAGRPVPEAAFWNVPQVYSTFTMPLPDFGGETIYLPGQPLPSINYPIPNDWGTRRPSHYAHLDQLARVYGFDTLIARPGGYWERVHVFDLWSMQHRFTTGQVFGALTEDTYGAREQLAAYHMATGWLALWLRHFDRIRITTATL